MSGSSSSSELESLYQEVVLEHARRPRNTGLLGDAAAVSHQINPTCGDEITLELHLADDGSVGTVRWEGHGCAISQSSASLLSELASAAQLADIQPLVDDFRTALRSRGTIQLDEDRYGDASLLDSVSRYSARVKCAMLGWVALEDAVRRAAATPTS